MGFVSFFTRRKSKAPKEKPAQSSQLVVSQVISLLEQSAQELEKRMLEDMAEACNTLPMTKTVDIGIIEHNLRIIHDPSRIIFDHPDTPSSLRQLISTSLTIPSLELTTSHNSDDNFVLTLSDFEGVKYVGRGGYGKVLLVHDRYSDNYLAMKMVSKTRLRFSGSKFVKMYEEQRIMRLLVDCPWVVKLQGSFEDELSFYLVMQYAAGGNLLHRLHKQRKFTQEAVKEILAELVLAVGALHSRRIMHRDIKLENILLDKDGHVLISDLGLSIGFDKETRAWNDAWPGYELHTLPEPKQVASWDKGRDLTAEKVGTPGYAAPEILDRGHDYYSYEIDIFSLGVCAYTLMTGKMPFGNKEHWAFEDLAKRTLYGTVAYPDNIDLYTRDLIDRMLAKDPRYRITIAEIKAHPYFRDTDWNRVARRENSEWRKDLIFGENKPRAIRKRNFRIPGGDLLDPRDGAPWFQYTSPDLSVRFQPKHDVEVYEADPTDSPSTVSSGSSMPPTPQLISDTTDTCSIDSKKTGLVTGLLEKWKNWGRKSKYE